MDFYQPAFPVVHLGPRTLRDPLRFLESCHSKGDIVKVRFGPFTSYLLCRTDVAWRVLVSDAQSFDKGETWDRIRRFAGNGLVVCGPDDHHRQRRWMQPAFTRASVTRYAALLSEEAERAACSWRPAQELDVLRVMKGMAQRAIIRAMLPSTDAWHADELVELFETMRPGVMLRLVDPFDVLWRLPLPVNRRFHRAVERVWDVADAMVAQAHREARPEELSSEGILALLLSAKDRYQTGDGPPVTDRLLRDQILTLLIAGSETVAVTLAWTFYLLAIHPDIERRLHAEVDQALTGGPADAEDLSRLPLARQIVLEALRLYPPIFSVDRRAVEAVELDGHTFPAGTSFSISPLLFHRDPEAFTEPDRFDPDRWNPERGGDISQRYFIPFVAGKRKCIGDVFALTEAVIALATLSSQWRLRLVPGASVKPRWLATLVPAGLHMVAEARHRQR